MEPQTRKVTLYLEGDIKLAHRAEALGVLEVLVANSVLSTRSMRSLLYKVYYNYRSTTGIHNEELSKRSRRSLELAS
jgi:hypothetical protein